MLKPFAVVAIVALAASSRGQVRTPSVADVMKKVGAYVQDYGQRASIVVGSERYTQETKGNTTSPHRERLILADVAIVRVHADGWVGFRDVLEVDGARQTDRRDRLLNLLTDDGDYTEARRLSDESARFNIGPVARNFNVPTAALFFFTPDNLGRFKFTARQVEADGSWHIAFRETQHPTLIRTPAGQSVPIEGELQVNPVDGTVLRTLIKTATILPGSKRQHAIGRIEVTYRYVEKVEMWLPALMEEQFDTTGLNNAWERLEGRATYSNYRKFTTSARIK